MTDLDSLLGPMRAVVITASDRASSGAYEDRSGPVLADGLRAQGYEVVGPRVVPDGDPVGTALRQAIAEGFDLIVTTGGTGLAPSDRTPEVTRPLLDREIPGIAEAIRAAGLAKGVAASMLSRGLAGQAATSLVINLPGSRGGCRDALVALEPVLVHAIAQLRGMDHEQAQACTEATAQSRMRSGGPS